MIESPENMTFNGVNLAESFTDSSKGTYFIVNNVDGRGVLGEEIETIEVPGMVGAYQSSKHTPVRELNVSMSMKGESFEDLRKRIDRLSAILVTDEPSEITFADEPGIVYYGSLAGVEHTLEVSGIYQAVLTFLCVDPFKYGEEQSYPFSSVPMEDGIGRNLTLRSRLDYLPSGGALGDVVVHEIVDDSEHGTVLHVQAQYYVGFIHVVKNFNVGDKVTMTMFMRAKEPDTLRVKLNNPYGDDEYLEVGTEWEEHSVVTTIKGIDNEDVGFNFYPSNTEYWVKWIKVEKGNIATDWTPAPEDRPSDILTLNYGGTAPASPIFELEVLKPSTFAMVQNGKGGYMMLGEPASDDVEVVDARKPVLQENGSTLSTWDTNPTRIDNWIGRIAGDFDHDGTGIFVENYGTGDKMHGPALIKEIPPTQDFEIETTFDIISNFDRDNYRMEFYMFDEGMNMLGKMGINDNNRNFTRRRGLARVGEYVDSTTRYLIGGSNYQYDNLLRVSLMYLRAKREGRKFTFYISEIRNGRHHVPITRTYTDQSGDYINPLKYVQIFVGNWQDRPRTFRTRINYINVFELAQETVDRTPNTMFPGDLVTFDNYNYQILINGEDAKNLKDLGASFFKLYKGNNQLVVQPSNSFKAVAKWQNRYR